MVIVPLIGCGLLALVVTFFVANLVTSYRTQGGAIGQVPVMAMAVYLPFVAALVGVMFEKTAGWPGWPPWTYGVFWLAATPLAWWATAQAGRLGERAAARDLPGQEGGLR